MREVEKPSHVPEVNEFLRTAFQKYLDYHQYVVILRFLSGGIIGVLSFGHSAKTNSKKL